MNATHCCPQRTKKAGFVLGVVLDETLPSTSQCDSRRPWPGVIFIGVSLDASGRRACFRGQSPFPSPSGRYKGHQHPAEFRRLCKRARTLCQDKMFQLWKLVLLCGLLAGTSASLLDIRGNDVLGKLISGLERGLGTFDSTLETIFQNLKTELEFRCSDQVVEETQQTENLLEQLISRIFQVVNRLTGVRIRNVQVPDITFEAIAENSADVKIPITADVAVNLPLLGEIVDLDLKVDLQNSVSIEKDAETGDPRVVVGECPNNPESISLTVLHRRFGLLNDVVDIGVNLARRVVSSVVQNELCPRIRELLESLDAECIKKLIGEPQEK